MLTAHFTIVPGSLGASTSAPIAGVRRSATQALVVLIGPPGSGKGTQAARISARYGLPSISTGDTLRAACADGTALGRQIHDLITAGELVSDAIMIDIMRDRLARADAVAGAVLDGFPRTIVQARALDDMSTASRVLTLVLDVSDAELEGRLLARRVCASCNTLHTTHVVDGHSPSRACTRCGATLVQREDDTLGTIRHRLATYHDTAGPLIDHYRGRPTTAIIDGAGHVDHVTQGIVDTLDPALGTR